MVLVHLTPMIDFQLILQKRCSEKSCRRPYNVVMVTYAGVRCIRLCTLCRKAEPGETLT